MKIQIWMAAIAASSLVLSGCGSSNSPLSSDEEARLSLVVECHIYARNYGLLVQQANSIASRWGMSPVERNPQPDNALADSTGALMVDFAEKFVSRGIVEQDKVLGVIKEVESRVLSKIDSMKNGGSSVENLQKISNSIAWLNENCYDL